MATTDGRLGSRAEHHRQVTETVKKKFKAKKKTSSTNIQQHPTKIQRIRRIQTTTYSYIPVDYNTQNNTTTVRREKKLSSHI